MKIVIDIDDDLYTRLFNNEDEKVVDMRRACAVIRKGIPVTRMTVTEFMNKKKESEVKS